MRRLAFAGLAVLGLTTSAAFAQTEQLPAVSRGEAQVNDLNRSITNQGLNRGAAEQQQFQTNQLRNQPQFQPVQPPTVGVLPR